jgi:acetyltransferase-like isoleucine patch superfamily enzyme
LRIVFDLPGRYNDGCPASKGDVVIGNDVWIGSAATILSGVHVGNGAVIGTASLVSKDIPAYSIVAGNPAREIGRRFSDFQIERLQSIAWWSWPIDEIIENVDLLCSAQVEDLIERME